MDDDRIAKLETEHGADFIETLTEEVIEQLYDRDRKSALPEGADGHVTVTDVEMINAANHVAAGSFWAGGTEYAFEVESGDNNGFVWRSVSADGPVPELDVERTTWALAPRSDLVAKARETGSERILLAKWDAFLTRPEIAKIPANYAYDTMVQPGSKTRDYWTGKAAEVGFVIVPEEQAAETRSQLATPEHEESPTP